jgi:Tol biopolymer transport system component
MKKTQVLSFAIALGALTLVGCGGSGGGSSAPAIPAMTIFINMESEAGVPSQLYRFDSNNPVPQVITSTAQGVNAACPNGLGDELFFVESGKIKSIHTDGSNLATYGSIGGVQSLNLNSAGDKILYIDEGDYGLYRADYNGNNIGVVVPDVPTTSRDAVFTPDGTKIYFNERSEANGTNDISSVLPNGSQKTNLTTDFAPGAHFPAVSPDGTKVAFTTDSGVYEMDADGQNKRKVTDADEPEHLAYSPDGQWLLYSESNGDRKVWIAKVDGTYKKKLFKTSAPMLRLVGARSL